MRPLRLSILILVAANGLAFYYFRQDDRGRPPPPPPPPDRGPAIERLVLLDERSDPTPETAPTPPADRPSGPATTTEQETALPTSSDPEPVSDTPVTSRRTTRMHCLRIGPFATADERRDLRETLARRIQGIFVDEDEPIDDAVTYWVSLPRQDHLPEAKETEAEISAQGIDDIAIIPVQGGYVVSLGVFRSKTIAERRRREIAALGHEVRIKERHRRRTRPWLVIRTHDTVTPEDLATTTKKVGLETTACPPSTKPERTDLDALDRPRLSMSN